MGALTHAAEEVDKELIEKMNARWNFLGGIDLDAELPPREWICEELALCAGAITIFGGAGFSGKTVCLMSLLLSVATGRLIWGKFKCQQGKVKHLDWEQGRDLTTRKYQRMAREMGIRMRDLEGIFQLSTMPDANLDEANAEKELVLMLRGVKVCAIDAFRGAFPKADENSSSSRERLTMLGRVSERTGCAIIVIAHSRKPSDGEASNQRTALRGSSSIYESAQTIFMLSGDQNGGPSTVENTKERIDGNIRPKFGIRIVDRLSPDPSVTDEKWGLAVEHVDSSEIAARPERDDSNEKIALNIERMSSLAGRIVATLDMRPEGSTPSALGLTFGVAQGTCATICKELVIAGTIREEGRGSDRRYYSIAREPGID
jgi:AAA domain